MSTDTRILGTLTAQCARIGLTLTVAVGSNGPVYNLTKGAWTRQVDDLDALAYAVAMRAGQSPTEALEQLRSRLQPSVPAGSYRPRTTYSLAWVDRAGDTVETALAGLVSAVVVKAAALSAP